MVEGQCTRMRVTSVGGGGGMKGATLGCNIRQRGESEAANLVEKFVRRTLIALHLMAKIYLRKLKSLITLSDTH